LTKAERETLLKVADWCKEEYRRLCMLPVKSPETESALKLVGMRWALADLEFGLRRWAETGKPPEHQKVLDEWRIPFERQAREDEELLHAEEDQGRELAQAEGQPGGEAVRRGVGEAER
jgi:hypothetical protein